MSDTKLKFGKFVGPLFKRDPDTGKIILLPLRSACNSAAKVKSSEKKFKRLSTLQPLKLTAADFEGPADRPCKIRKTETNSVRKELFYFSQSKTSRQSLGKGHNFTRSINTRKVSQKKFKSELSPLLDMEEVEEEIIKKKGFLQGYPFKTPSKPCISFTSNSMSELLPEKFNSDNVPRRVITEDLQPSALSNEAEVLELEKMCTGNRNESPISSVCNLLEGTKINSPKRNNMSIQTTPSNIKSLINDIKDILVDTNAAVQNYKTSHEVTVSKTAELMEVDNKQYENMVTLQNLNNDKLKNLLNKLKSINTCTTSKATSNKENTPLSSRRSARLLIKSPQVGNAKLVVSPNVLKSKDLRKSTLTKNLASKTQQYNIDSPRIQRALNMYNSMRSDVPVLMTPQLNRNYLVESPKSTNLTRSLSRRIQYQCLLLQDTPVHK